jgi:hypothetical protein
MQVSATFWIVIDLGSATSKLSKLRNQAYNRQNGNAGIALAPCCRPQTKVHADALPNTSVRDATEVKILLETLWRLVSSATAAGIVGRRRSHLKIIASSFVSDLQRDDGTMPTVQSEP